MLRGNSLFVGFCALLLLGLVPAPAAAVPVVDITFVETPLGGGSYRYDFTIFNLSDPVADAGVDLYEATLNFSPAVTAAVVNVPTDWDSIGGGLGSGFVQFFSLAPGAPPAGADIGPGQSLGVFRVVFDQQVGALAFEATLANPGDPRNPFLASATTRQVLAAPEPGLLLFAAAAIGAAASRRRRRG